MKRDDRLPAQRMKRLVIPGVLAVVAIGGLVELGCGDEHGAQRTVVDAGIADARRLDAAVDASPDAPPDGSLDAPHDAAIDAEIDAEPG